MQKKRSRTITLVTAAALFVGGCQSLDVPNFNNPGIDQAKLNPANLETQSGTAFRYLFSVMQGSDVRNNTTYYPSFALSCMGNEQTIGTSNLGRNQDVCLEPRVAMNNFDQGQWINRTPYQMLYGGIAAANDVLEGVQVHKVQIGVPTPAAPNGLHTDRNVWWPTFVIGASHMYLATLFDKAIIVPPGKPYDATNLDPAQFKPYREVADSAISFLRQAIAIAQAAPDDSTNLQWINGGVSMQLSKAEAIRVMNSFLARALVWPARDVTERGQVDWAAVITAVDAGITKNFQQTGVSTNDGTISYYKNLVQLQTDSRPSTRLVGPADASGAYQAWLALPLDQRNAITITSADKRISNADLSAPGGAPTAGAYIQLNSAQTMTTTLGTWNLSNYRGVKFGLGTANNYSTQGVHDLITVREMQLLKAEALIRIGGAANIAQAVTIINASRTANPCSAAGCATGGNLPAVTAAGVPVSATCVPRRDDGACGDLMDALMWESRIENYGIEATTAYVNARGWGKLLPGTAIHLPIPGRELQTFKMAYYTFGGPGNPGSAP
jgi:hypothetical protein